MILLRASGAKKFMGNNLWTPSNKMLRTKDFSRKTILRTKENLLLLRSILKNAFRLSFVYLWM